MNWPPLTAKIRTMADRIASLLCMAVKGSWQLNPNGNSTERTWGLRKVPKLKHGKPQCHSCTTPRMARLQTSLKMVIIQQITYLESTSIYIKTHHVNKGQLPHEIWTRHRFHETAQHNRKECLRSKNVQLARKCHHGYFRPAPVRVIQQILKEDRFH